PGRLVGLACRRVQWVERVVPTHARDAVAVLRLKLGQGRRHTQQIFSNSNNAIMPDRQCWAMYGWFAATASAWRPRFSTGLSIWRRNVWTRNQALRGCSVARFMPTFPNSTGLLPLGSAMRVKLESYLR